MKAQSRYPIVAHCSRALMTRPLRLCLGHPSGKFYASRRDHATARVLAAASECKRFRRVYRSRISWRIILGACIILRIIIVDDSCFSSVSCSHPTRGAAFRDWGETFPDCYGNSQSPINLSEAHQVRKHVSPALFLAPQFAQSSFTYYFVY